MAVSGAVPARVLVASVPGVRAHGALLRALWPVLGTRGVRAVPALRRAPGVRHVRGASAGAAAAG
ncbi:hypothetical protein, partial [Streptomyces sp. MUM 2J]|uniref:hypothetical protein n=1 Tax=Streptomyces sp. MUM 2J TaxID=2791987 RepID=UPI001F0382B3